MKKMIGMLIAVSLATSCGAENQENGKAAPPEEAQLTDKAKYYVGRIEKKKPAIIVVGNSMQGEAVDFRALSAQVKQKAMDVKFFGCRSAWKYGYLKYAVANAKHTPRLVVVVTRMNFITTAPLRAEYQKKKIAELAGTDRARLDERVYKIQTEGAAPPWKPEWNGVGEKNSPSSNPVGSVPENSPFWTFYWDFPKAVEKSFLPDMIEIAKAKGFGLVILRYKSRALADTKDYETPIMRKYRADLAAYLLKNGVHYLDYMQDPRITPDLYKLGDHLSRDKGKPLFTGLLAKDLKAILASPDKPVSIIHK